MKLSREHSLVRLHEAMKSGVDTCEGAIEMLNSQSGGIKALRRGRTKFKMIEMITSDRLDIHRSKK